MSGTISFDASLFRIQCPAFSNTSDFPDAYIQIFWNVATNYVSNSKYGYMSVSARTAVINFVTAHLITLSLQIAGGNTPGIVTGATVDKVSVQIAEPPAENAWQYWLQETPYGQQALALLQVQSAGGWGVGGSPVTSAFNRGCGLGLRGFR